MKTITHLSPNCNERPAIVDAIILHATASANTKVDVDWCCTPKPKNPNPVSYHVIVDRDGTVHHLVDTAKRAWHAGVSTFAGRRNCNDYAIGLSFANKNDGKEPYTDDQYETGAALVAAWMRKHPAITVDRITTHAAVATPPGRKTDPLKFDMKRFLESVAAEQRSFSARAAVEQPRPADSNQQLSG